MKVYAARKPRLHAYKTRFLRLISGFGSALLHKPRVRRATLWHRSRRYRVESAWTRRFATGSAEGRKPIGWAGRCIR